MTDEHVKMDYKAHERTYEGFIRGSKFVGAATILILILMALFLL